MNKIQYHIGKYKIFMYFKSLKLGYGPILCEYICDQPTKY